MPSADVASRVHVQQFCKLLEEWLLNVAVCKDCLEGLERLLQGMAQSEEQHTAPHEQQQSRFMMMAPSATLQATLACSAPAAWEGSMLAAQDDYMILQEVVHRASELHASISSVAQSFHELAIHASVNEEQSEDPDILPGTHVSDCFTDIDIDLIDEPSSPQAHEDVPSSPMQGTNKHREPCKLNDAELALLMNTLLGQLELELALMAKVCLINLATPAPEVRTFIFLMELQPFLDMRLVGSLRQISSSQLANTPQT
ncbi:hypothetical protein DUNSADRAFT_4209 [Dunaliella salina]|uniref:Uncharacterized protein n=1 Tax=Dunaliella salina TaxID=3046 RepID=A0ABQ7FVP7_DUNSA|nr:hypothetical protein DUNSADRAFT_4209 [Dunaliella salina]|eukprot:KAF5826197.1 hypothetical protein DUNSADRAFT_4209 [Dunaliella salina]